MKWLIYLGTVLGIALICYALIVWGGGIQRGAR